MRKAFVPFVLALTLFVAGTASAAGKAKPAAKAPAGGISDATVSAAVTEFVESLSSMDDDRVLAAVSAGDRGALKGRSDLIGLVYPNKLQGPKVTSFEKLEVAGKTIGVTAKITVEETDPVENLKKSKEHTWFLALDGNQLRVSLASVWLDADMVR